MDNVAYVSFNVEENRYELTINNVLKAYVQADAVSDPRKILAAMAKEKGYTVVDK